MASSPNVFTYLKRVTNLIKVMANVTEIQILRDFILELEKAQNSFGEDSVFVVTFNEFAIPLVREMIARIESVNSDFDPQASIETIKIKPVNSDFDIDFDFEDSEI
jgi:hypothetical protein